MNLSKKMNVTNILVVLVGLSGCVSSPLSEVSSQDASERSLKISDSFIKGMAQNPDQGSGMLESNQSNVQRSKDPSNLGRMSTITPLPWRPAATADTAARRDLFSLDNEVTLTAEKMPLVTFIHYVFGQLLNRNYVLDKSVDSEGSVTSPVTLDVNSPVSSFELFELAEKVLQDRGILLKNNGGTFFIYRASAMEAKPVAVIAIGRLKQDVPETTQRILQVVPLRFGIKMSIERSIRNLTNAKVTAEFDQSAVYIEGTRDQVIRALDLINMLDVPAMRGRHVGLLELTYVDPGQFAAEVADLLALEGIDVAIQRGIKKNLVLVPLKQRGALVVFATEQFMLDRVRYWAELNDVPGEANNNQYFVYTPNAARASDLGESVSSLLTGFSTPNISDTSTNATGAAPSARRSVGINQDDFKMVVDERANLLLFYTNGTRYQNLLPLLSRLDVLPKQIVLDITIAEVTLKDEFRHGVEWAYNQGEVNVTTQGAFGASGIGGLGVFVDGLNGPFVANLMGSNSLVKVLSNPSMMVRDGVTATIDVGSQISVVGETTQDPINGDRQTTSSSYRQTGVNISVTPTVNASDVVVMEVMQSISNSVPGSAGAGGNPDIMQRSLNTEVMARSGQTIILGGLISETESGGDSGIPGLSRLPLLGNLFKSKSNTQDRTELVMLITPKVLANSEAWEATSDSFRESLRFLGVKPR